MRVGLPRHVNSHPNRPHSIFRVVQTRTLTRTGLAVPRSPTRHLTVAASMANWRIDMETDLEHDQREDDALRTFPHE